MGLFSSIGKAFKSIFKGIGKVFKAILKPVAKFLSSDLGKALMIAVSVFTLGTSLLAGAQGFAAGQGFLGKFVNGGKEFLNSLLGTGFETVGGAAEGVAGAAGATGEIAASNAVTAGDVLTGAETALGGGASADAAGSALSQAGQLAGDTSKVGNMAAMQGAKQAGAAATTAAVSSAAKEPSWLQKAASTALDFAKSPSGQTLIGSTLSGAASGAQQKEMLEHERRVERMFEDPNDPGMKMLQEHDYNIDVPRGLAGASNAYARRQNQQPGRYTPSIPFARPVTPGA